MLEFRAKADLSGMSPLALSWVFPPKGAPSISPGCRPRLQLCQPAAWCLSVFTVEPPPPHPLFTQFCWLRLLSAPKSSCHTRPPRHRGDLAVSLLGLQQPLTGSHRSSSLPPIYSWSQSVSKCPSRACASSAHTLERFLLLLSGGHWNSAHSHRAPPCRPLPSWEPPLSLATPSPSPSARDVPLDPTGARPLPAFLSTKPQTWSIKNAEFQHKWFHPLIPPQIKRL